MKGFLRWSVLFAWLGICAATDVRAQAPFASLEIGGAIGTDVAEARFQEHWATRLTPMVWVRTPAYGGNLEAGVRASYHDGRDQMDFRSALLHVGWGPSIDLGEALQARLTAVAGDYFMLFDERRAGYARRENELTLGLAADLVVGVANPLAVFVRGEYLRVYTSTPIDIVQVGAGAAFRLETPSWLRPLLR